MQPTDGVYNPLSNSNQTSVCSTTFNVKTMKSQTLSTDSAPEVKKIRIEEVTAANIQKSEQIPDEIPEERNAHIDNIKKRRSSLRRSINGGFASTLRAACSSIDASAPASEKIRRIVELSVNHSLLSLKNTLEDDADVFEFEQAIMKKMENILTRVEANTKEDAAKQQETETRKHINRLKEERNLWNEEFTSRRQAYQEARTMLKDVTKGKVQIEKGHLKPDDVQFLKSLPDLDEVNKRIGTYQNRHQIGMIELERSARNVQHTLEMTEKKICKAKKIMAPTFTWPTPP